MTLPPEGQIRATLEVEVLPPGGRAGAAAALRKAHLPVEDLDRDDVVLFAFRADGRPVGFGGLELHGPDALIRSIAVDPAVRGAGAGRAITAHLIDHAARSGARRAYLLTTDAAGFFERLGFAATPRETASDAIRGTPQMAALCPSTATLLVRTIG